MTHEVFAPQFGIYRALTAQRLDEPPPVAPPSSLPEQASDFLFKSSGPTVIVKRRRHLEVPTEEASANASPAPTPPEPQEGSAVEHKEAKVFRLDHGVLREVVSATSDVKEPADEAPVASTDSAAPQAREQTSLFSLAPPNETLEVEAPKPAHPPRLRRRRDPLKAPTLLQHVVLERPESEAQEQADAKALERGVDVDDFVRPGSVSEYQAVMQSLAQLKRTVDQLIEGRRVLDALNAAVAEVDSKRGQRRKA